METSIKILKIFIQRVYVEMSYFFCPGKKKKTHTADNRQTRQLEKQGKK